MLRILKCFPQIKTGLPYLQLYNVLQRRTYPTDQTPSDDGSEQTPDDPVEEIRQGLYTGGPLHLRVDQMQSICENEERAFMKEDESEDDQKDQTLEDEETEQILEGLYTGEPLRLRVDQIKRDAEEIQMMGNQIGHDKHQQETKEETTGPTIEEMSDSARKWRAQRSERYFPKKKKPPRASTLNELKVETVIRSYWARGHLGALIDPLYILRKPVFRPEFPSRTVLREHRVPVDKETLYHLLPNDATTLGGGYNRIKLDKLINRLNDAYCDTIGAEFSYIHDLEVKNWIKDRLETTELRYMHRKQQRYCMKKLVEIETFAEFLKDKIPKNQLRYIPLGSESSLLGVDLLLERAMKKHNARMFVFGMRRLGRLNLIANVLQVNPMSLFSLLQSEYGKSKGCYCLGTKSTAHSSFLKGVLRKTTLLSSSCIPENYYPLTLGYVKGMQLRHADDDGENVWPIIIHMAKGLNSQGIVYETLKLNQLPHYETGGTIHLVFNNQMEQTLRRETHMRTEYCTDTLRTLHIPILHVNGDDLKAVHFAVRLAADFRAQFHRDIAVDIVSYSRFMTQRTVVKFELIQVQQAITQTEPIVSKYSRKLIKEGSISPLEIDNWRREQLRIYTEAWNEASKFKDKLDKNFWTSQNLIDKILDTKVKYGNIDYDTGVDIEKLNLICKSLCSPPETITMNPKHIGFLKRRRYLIENNRLDWVLCEALAYGSLLLEGKFIRISGMDVNRRFHIVQEDAAEGETFNLMNNIDPQQGKYYLCKSTTSQYATAAFEYGFSTTTLRTLVIWEAPEGDKTSKAQVVIDNYIAGGYLKFNYHSNIVFLVPHYHKCESASKVCNGRPERFLQLTNNSESQAEFNAEKQMKATNMILANVSTPANFFHIIRRQMYMPYRRPLVIFTPNLLVSHPECKAQFSELAPGAKFQPYISDPIADFSNVQRIILCTGRIYYDLKSERKARHFEDKIAICRIEQICPLPYKLINDDLSKYYSANTVWVQEEPINQGWWSYIEPRLSILPPVRNLDCVARQARADGGSRSIASCYDEHFGVIDRALHFK